MSCTESEKHKLLTIIYLERHNPWSIQEMKFKEMARPPYATTMRDG